MYKALYKHKRKYYYYIMEQKYDMTNADKVYLISCAVLFVGMLFMAGGKLK